MRSKLFGRRTGFLSFEWPDRYRVDGTHFPGDQLLAGLRSLDLPVRVSDITQLDAPGRPNFPIVTAVATIGDQRELIAFDLDDRQGIVEEVAERTLVYFKFQYAQEGYEQANVVPGGYLPANARIYRYLRLLRTIRSLRLFRYDVYCRLGLRYGGQEERLKAHEILSARTDIRYEGSLFRYPGGPDKVPYRRYLFEIPRAKVCVDVPGNGDFTTRFVDYLAIGACIVKPPPLSRLPIQPIDGVHVVYCASDLSDLGDVCAQLARDDEVREGIARNARDFFDRHLHRQMLAGRYVDAVTELRSSAPRRRPARPQQRQRRQRFVAVCAAALLAVGTFVAVPEALGDHPYDPQPSRILHGERLHIKL